MHIGEIEAAAAVAVEEEKEEEEARRNVRVVVIAMGKQDFAVDGGERSSKNSMMTT